MAYQVTIKYHGFKRHGEMFTMLGLKRIKNYIYSIIPNLLPKITIYLEGKYISKLTKIISACWN